MSIHGQPYQWMLTVNPSLLSRGFRSAHVHHVLKNDPEFSSLLDLKPEMAEGNGSHLEDGWGHSQILIDPKKDYKGALISKILFSINNKLKRQNPSIYLITRNLDLHRKQSKFAQQHSKNDQKKYKLNSSMQLLKKKDPKEPTKAKDVKTSSKKLSNPMRNTLHSLMQKLPEKKTHTNLNKSVPAESFELSLIEAKEELSLSTDQDFHSNSSHLDKPLLSNTQNNKKSKLTNCSNFSSDGAARLEPVPQLQSLSHARDKSGEARGPRRGFKSPEKPIFFRGENLNPRPCNNLKSVIDSGRRNPQHRASESFELTCTVRDLSEELAIRSSDKKENSFSFLKQMETPKGKKPRKCLGDFLLANAGNRQK